MATQRENLSSRLGFLLLAAGCSIGLGNIWRFPFVTGQCGGACFVGFYLIFLLLMGFPVMVMELAVGRGSRRTLYGAAAVLPQNKRFPWRIPAGIFFAGSLVLMAFYTTVTGWMLAYAVDYCSGVLPQLRGEAISDNFNALLASPQRSCAYMLLTVVMCSAVCALGLKNGVEKITKFLMAGLFFLLILLCIRAVTLPGAAEGLKFYLMPDFDAVASIGWGNVIVTAMGQAFFTLSIGVGAIEIFGSYISKERSLPGEALIIIALDTLVALLAGVVIFPACSSYGVDVSSGPKLVFISLPEVFNRMNPAWLWGGMFFIFMSVAALTTVIAVFENLIAFMIDELKFARRTAALLNGVVIALISLPCALGYNLLKHIEPLGKGSTILDLEDYIISDNLLPLGAVFFIILCTLPAAWGWKKFFAEANAGSGIKLPSWAKYYCMSLLPLVILALFATGFVRRWL